MMDEILIEYYDNSPSYKKAKALCDQYNMISWNDLAKKNEVTITEIRNRLKENKL